MKILDERETQKKKNKDRKKQGGGRSCSERVRAKWFCCAFKLGFLQLICQRELYESKHVAVECRCLKI